MPITPATLTLFSTHCSELLIHAADAEGLQAGIDEDLVALLGEWARTTAGPAAVPITYAGGARSVADLELVERLSDGRVDLTIGSALDIFGGQGVRFDECVSWNRGRDLRDGQLQGGGREEKGKEPGLT